METETKTGPAALTHHPVTDKFTVHRAGQRVLLSRDELQAIVQAAYDEHGILASPSYALEAERAEDKARGCPCGLEGCSDRSAYVAEYRAGLQVGGL